MLCLYHQNKSCSCQNGNVSTFTILLILITWHYILTFTFSYSSYSVFRSNVFSFLLSFSGDGSVPSATSSDCATLLYTLHQATEHCYSIRGLIANIITLPRHSCTSRLVYSHGYNIVQAAACSLHMNRPRHNTGCIQKKVEELT